MASEAFVSNSSNLNFISATFLRTYIHTVRTIKSALLSILRLIYYEKLSLQEISPLTSLRGSLEILRRIDFLANLRYASVTYRRISGLNATE